MNLKMLLRNIWSVTKMTVTFVYQALDIQFLFVR